MTSDDTAIKANNVRTKEAEFLSRGVDHLGILGAKLRDLQGFSTLAYELIQNADDAPQATSVTFSVWDTSLVVDNDGVFSDCRRIEAVECPWKTDSARGYRCDFHRFRHIASGDKRAEVGTTGAFGIGFIAVYQITDVPELISAGRHWILHEAAPEHQRIEVCGGCERCKESKLPGTRVILPWARDSQSVLRQGLQAEAVSPDAPQRILAELERSLPIAMLFLKRLRCIRIECNGHQYRAFQRIDEGDHLILTDGDSSRDRIWHLVHGDFSETADVLRARHPGIEEKRSAKVTLAFPEAEQPRGLLCVCLPTQQDTGLPFHINADFFPTSDRKRVILAADYQSDWNREALAAAASAWGDSLVRLSKLLGATRFWGCLDTLKRVAETEHGDETLAKALAKFWKVVTPHLKSAKVIYTTNGQWTTSAESCLLSQKEEAAATPILEMVGLSVVHENLRPYQTLLRSAAGVGLLDISRLCRALENCGLIQRVEPGALPSFLSNIEKRAVLWREICLLLDRQPRTAPARANDEQRLKVIALAPGGDGAFWPCGQLFNSDESTIELFQSLGADVPFASEDPEFAPLAHLCNQFGATVAIDFLGKLGCDRLTSALNQRRPLLSQLFHWLENHRQEILDNPATKQALASLAIFPSSGELRTLVDLSLPGNFEDHLGLADLVDLPALGGRREFLRDLGMAELDFRTYALSSLPAALSNSAVPSEKRRAAVMLIATQLGEIKDDPAVRRALAGSALVECGDGEFRNADHCYFDEEIVRTCLGNGVFFVRIPDNHHRAIMDFYEWLGVASKPRHVELVARLRAMAGQAYSQDVAQVIGKIMEYLGGIVTEALPRDLESLRTEAWLPARGKADRWYRPTELYAVYQSYLFDSQALFLDVANSIQNSSRRLLEVLGIKITPDVNLVVKHLLHCADRPFPVNRAVYRFLNENAEDPALNLLQDKKCLFLGESYLKPNQVFWGEHPFGHYRSRLSEELRSYGHFLGKIGVRDAPDRGDALKVLTEIATEFGGTNSPLDNDAYAVAMSCWQFLEKTLDGDVPAVDLAVLRKVRCVPNTRRLLQHPDWMFFEDRAGLAGKFGEFLAGNVIPRPLGACEAMAQAGVRPLRSVVEIRLLECNDPTENSAMAERILDRRNQFGRVLESQIPGQRAEMALRHLARIRFVAVGSLLICYRISVFKKERESPPESEPAFYECDQERLLFARRDGTVPWAAIARELAVALFPEEDPGLIAASLKEVLAAESPEEAGDILDDLGFARLDTSDRDIPIPGLTSGRLGTDGQAPEQSSTTTPEDALPPAGITSMTPEEAIKSPLGAAAPVSTPSPLGGDTELSGTGRRGSSGAMGRTEKRNSRPVLRSYLPGPRSSDTKLDNDDENGDEQGRSLVDKAGVQHVLRYETEHQRIPEEMPHNNPGYDIESRDGSGRLVRYIEVKSFSGKWNCNFAALSRPQFDAANKLGDAFWLYVVEQAETKDFRIHRIQNPALKANHFMFDDGWRSIAEQDDPRE